ncbi:LysM peptidoglycan-binding domain-containing protein [Lacticaseibacillus casei]|uniref:LysM peptidoglycan-binding domain-containing protein n=1 Tax=Lacticaseibacillus huelsenbergensis TaxID=3035291 RepID=A0ABY8DP59_9LACO|nr:MULTISPECIES: LysM domain-containing protein [Lacticaseibacillus]MDG3061964.1 LysM peptidoglycan-binding domain-containing protein [Lacticaseibacillus sp. BCRC 81376]QVI37973.1 LysM peptidoglycan-binding domain-containing protein [Lacticaseibacillus casei]QXG59762.1 LysM peptidoglycan-binding domain-containing protein [Lacticaseibacillus casei]WFB38771.1 LysM peptidoglycan-binding domain-containing protein [Lacticaseibacillus huelsenbergensis]WFB43166.1 LysM peptidoglycan-binding domain-con
MKNSRKRRRLQVALEKQSHRVSLVHSKHRGWFTLGLTSIGLGIVAVGLAGQTNVVNASSNQQITTQKSTSTTGRVWTLRPVSQIEAQIKASNKTVYDIQWGDTLSTISEALNHTGFTTSVNRLAEINHIANVNLIYAGAKLYLQGSGENATVTTKDAAGNDQTYNLNPAKPAIVTPQQNSTGSNGQSIGNEKTTVTDAALIAGHNHSNTGTSNDKSVPNKNDIDAAIKAAKEEQARLQAEREAAEKAKQEAEAKLTELLNAENGQTLAQLQTKRTAAQAAVDTAKAKVQSTTQALQAAQQAYATAKQAADTATANTASKQTQVDTATAGINSQTSQIQSLQAQLDTINADAQAAKDPATQAKVATLKNALTKAQQGLQTYEQQLSQASQQLSTAKQAETAAQQALANAKNQLDSFNGQVTSANAELQQANTNLAALPQQATAKNSDQAKQLKADLANYDAQLTTLDGQLKTLNDQIQAWQQTIAAVQTKLDQAKEQTTKANTANVAAQANDTTSAGQQAQTTIDHTNANMPKDDHVPVNTDKQVTVKVDEQGHQLSDTTGYKLIKTSAPVKTVQTLANGDTITTYTTTETYHQIQHFTKQVTVNVDENGQTLQSTNGYTKASGDEKTTTKKEVTQNGDVTTVITTTVTWKKATQQPGQRDIYETVNKDEQGNLVTPSDAYHLMTIQPSTKETTDPDGTIVTHHITTNVYHKIQYFTKDVTVNVDENGHTLTSTEGYNRIKDATKTSSRDEVAKNGDTTTVVTTTILWEKPNSNPNHKTVKITVKKDENGDVLVNTDGYHLISRNTSSENTTDNDGNVTTTVTTTEIYHKIQHFYINSPTVINIDEMSGEKLTSTANYIEVDKTTSTQDHTAANGDIYSVTKTVLIWRNKSIVIDPIVAAIKKTDDPMTKAISDQITKDDTQVDIQEAETYTNSELSLRVAKLFNEMVNKEQTRTGHTLTKLNTLPKDNLAMAERAVEVMYDFNHGSPDKQVPGKQYSPGWVNGEPSQTFNTENISQSSIKKSAVVGNLDNLIKEIANAMYQQYITDELPENNDGKVGGHYDNIINSNFDSLVAAVYVVDTGSYYRVSTAVSTGRMGTYMLY